MYEAKYENYIRGTYDVCSPGGGRMCKKEDKPAVIVEYSDTLADIFPEMPASWIYNGTAEYSHVMSLSEVYDTKGQKIYRVLVKLKT